jgi:hypothetical protein
MRTAGRSGAHGVSFDWRSPDYTAVFAERARRLAFLREHVELLPAIRTYYREHPAQFPADWGMTHDPRLAERGLPTTVPFVPWPKQTEALNWMLARWRSQQSGLIEKSRDSGATYLAVALAATLCLFHDGLVVGFGSRKEEYIDKLGVPKSIFEKLRLFLQHLPPEFLGGWERDKHAPYLRCLFPATHSVITGEAGDGIGRGDRTSLYFVDEAAFLEHPELTDASLLSTTNCRIDISTPHGSANAFAVKRHSNLYPVLTLHWRDDPRKGPQWYERQRQLLDPVTLAQEVDIDYRASVEGVVIPAAWVNSTIAAHVKLGIEPSGARRAALDVGDEGRDKNALAIRHGIVLTYLKSWSGKQSTIYRTTARVINTCDTHGVATFDYDADGLGAGVRGDAVDINQKRAQSNKPEIEAVPFRGSGAVFDPDGALVEGRPNRDFFANLKAQSWWALRLRFENTHRAVTEHATFNADDLISLDPSLPELNQLCVELSQPTYTLTAAGKVLVDKVPDGAASPNLADACCICFSPFQSGAYFAASRRAAAAAPNSTPVTLRLPARLDGIFATVAFSDDSAAIVYCGTNRPALGAGLWLLDFDLIQLDACADRWLRGAEEHLVALRDTVGGDTTRVEGFFVDDFASGWA